MPAIFEHTRRGGGSSEGLLAHASEAGLGHTLEAHTVTRATAQAFQNSAAQAIALRDA